VTTISNSSHMKLNLILAFLALGSFTLHAQQYTISTIAGGGALPASAPAASVNITVSFITVSSGGDVYFSSDNAVMKVDSQGILTRIAGTGVYGISADGGSATATTLAWPAGLAIEGAGNLYIAENAAHRVRKVSPQGVITTVAGTGSSGYSGDGGPALSAQLNWPTALALDAAGIFSFRIQRIKRFVGFRRVGPFQLSRRASITMRA
jgi:hypothetical protein